MSSDVEKFARLFHGRIDAYGSDGGSCVRVPVTIQTYVRHLDGSMPIGIYPLLDDSTCWWGCSDIDQGYDMIALAANLWRVLRVLGVFSYVEKSRSKGYHIWTFFDQPVAATTVRAMFLFAHQVADVPPREINPKASGFDHIELGNYVRLAYPNRGISGKQIMLDMERSDRCPMSFGEFLSCARTNTPADIESVAARYVPPAPRQLVSVSEYNGELAHLEHRMSGLQFTVWSFGPKADGTNRTSTAGSGVGAGKVDRSFQAYRFACLLQKDGFTPGEALALLCEFDLRWLQKFSERPDGVMQMQRIIERAYG